MEISIEGSGGEFQHHKISVDELEEIIKEFDENGIDALLDEHFSGGYCFDISPNPGMYGVDVDDMEVSVDFSAVDGCETEDSTDEVQVDNCAAYADFYYITSGKIYGNSDEFEDEEEFEPSKLLIKYSSYEVESEGLCGSIISDVSYNGNPISIDWGDNGVDLRNVLIYDVWEDGCISDTLRIHYLDDDEGEWVFDREAALIALDHMKKAAA